LLFSRFKGKLLVALGNTLQHLLSQEVLNRLTGEEHSEMSEEQVNSAFKDALFCYEEAKKIQRLYYINI
jgi:hypothetical protein